ncbi:MULTISPECIES: (d)CMP kinase [unclassified Sphingopyxis]|jgi:CMP/dCMP kinase|uniref:(d)CMP kinase n=1 Tax=unclassified Sphingopyxis TaxID=2614943 RepID=UPI002859692A|nr:MULTISPECIES: (d)CMP kinase [unclassified Sphingopyxis]MDR6832164.1 cytidylate kinase [Sphingopyxis sp. BE122]MDR7227907.1 cytidylate kinase [Sphingopyxis sp. BE259]
MIIAVDGPTASGKGTIARALGDHFGLPVLDTGLLYRAVGYQTQLNHGDADNAADALAACDFPGALLDDPALRYETTGGLASRVSVHPQVRAALFQRQVDFANQPGGAILDGRDIGTVIAPHADAKLFVTASADVRARRRHAEMLSRGVDVTYDAVLADVHARDARDTGRADAPLLRADDAMLLDNSDMPRDAAIAAAIAFVEGRLNDRG